MQTWHKRKEKYTTICYNFAIDDGICKSTHLDDTPKTNAKLNIWMQWKKDHIWDHYVCEDYAFFQIVKMDPLHSLIKLHYAANNTTQYSAVDKHVRKFRPRRETNSNLAIK